MPDNDRSAYADSVTTRRYVFPGPGDDLAAIAARELPEVEGAEQQLLSWNLHLAARAGLGRAVGLLPSDIVFTEPPLPPAARPAAPRVPAQQQPGRLLQPAQ